MNFYYLILLMLICLVINFLFFLVSIKQNSSGVSFSSFECGYTSYFFSHYSFSIHYFMLAMIFLFLDLELCFLLLFLNDFLSMDILQNFLISFVGILLLSLLYEWVMGKLEWIYWA